MLDNLLTDFPQKYKFKLNGNLQEVKPGSEVSHSESPWENCNHKLGCPAEFRTTDFWRNFTEFDIQFHRH